MSLSSRLWIATRHYYDLGFTAFGGPPVHFHILHNRFVEELKWIDEKAWSELFSVSQALPGPASTKLVYAICLRYAGFLPAVLAFFLWSIPGALGMYGLALGISNVDAVLPSVVYDLLSGLNAATVGLVALAAMQLSNRAITDTLTRTLLVFSACAGLCYTALWYFPMLMASCALVAILWDLWLRKAWSRLRDSVAKRAKKIMRKGSQETSSIPLESSNAPLDITIDQSPDEEIEDPNVHHSVGFRTSIAIIVVFFAIFIVFMVLRSQLAKVVTIRLFSNLFLAGTIIFGGGPVVIPLLREYIVAEGWVSPRDFLLGLAVIQAFPGPNFNFAVYLGALTASSAQTSSALTAFLSYIAIFLPGMMLATALSSLWLRFRKYQVVTSGLRGINAAAIGLVWTAVYRLWEFGYLSPSSSSGKSLGLEAWWLVVAATAFCGNQWYGVPAPVAIMLGGVLGIARWGVINK